jgi:hypothetical protein
MQKGYAEISRKIELFEEIHYEFVQKGYSFYSHTSVEE